MPALALRGGSTSAPALAPSDGGGVAAASVVASAVRAALRWTREKDPRKLAAKLGRAHAAVVIQHAASW